MTENEGNNKDCELKSFERNNYFYGKLMTVRDFDIEQQYFNGKRWLINRNMFGKGTVCGLNVESTDMSLTIKSGIAIDACGHEIVVPEDIRIDVLKNDILSKKIVYLTYSWCFKERVRAQTASTCEEVCENNRIQENYKVEIKDPQGGSENSVPEICGVWGNHLIKNIILDISGKGQIQFKRITRKYASNGDIFDVELRVTAIQDIQQAKLEDILPEGMIIIDGTANLGVFSMSAGQSISGRYFVKIDSDDETSLNITAKIDEILRTETKSEILIKDPAQIQGILETEVDGFLTNPCQIESKNTGIALAEISLSEGKLIVDNTIRQFVNNNKYITQMLECLKLQTNALNDQSAIITKKTAPIISLNATKDSIDANGTDKSEITISVTDEAGVALSGVNVTLISTVGDLDLHNGITDKDGKISVELTSNEPGISSIIATTGICMALKQITLKPVLGKIVGIVTEKTENSEKIAIENATVAIGINSDNTDTYGNYTLNSIPEGPHIVVSMKSGYIDATSVVNVGLNVDTNLDITLVKVATEGSISGTISDSATEKPIVGATVTAGEKSANTNSDGNYKIEKVPTGTNILVTASADDYRSSNRSGVEVKAGETTTGINMTLLKAKGVITGRATSIKEIPIIGAIVSVRGTGLFAKTDGAGNYGIENIPLGLQIVEISAKGYDPDSKEVIIKTQDKPIVNFQLTPVIHTGTIIGIVTDKGKIGISDAKVVVKGMNLYATADIYGKYAIYNVPQGWCTVIASASNYIERYAEVNVVAEGEVIANLILENIQVSVEYVPYYVFDQKSLIVRGGLCIDGKKNCITRDGISGGGYYARIGGLVAINGKSDKLVKLLIEQGTSGADKKTLSAGEIWEIGGGWMLNVNAIDARTTPRQVWITLSKDGAQKDDLILLQGQAYTYTENISGEIEVPLFVTYIDAIFSGATADMVQFRYSWAIDVASVKPCMVGRPGNVVECIAGKPGIVVECVAGKPGIVVDCVAGKPGIVVECVAGKPGNVVDCVAGKPGNVVECVAGKPGNVVECVAGKPGNVVECVAGKPGNVVECVAGKPGNIIECVAGKPGNVVECVVGKPGNVTSLCTSATPKIITNIDRPISKTACPGGRPSIAPKKVTKPQVKAKGGTNK